MAKLSDQERRQWIALRDAPFQQPPPADEERFVAPTVEARERYMRFLTEASKFFRGTRPVPFKGDNWKL